MEMNMKFEIKSFKSMMKSCYAYNELSKENYFLQKYKDIFGEENFNKMYNEEKEYLETNFTIKQGTYTDHEGCTYNSLIKK